jgi:hypothetical protein
MAISFNSVGHFFAKAFQAVTKLAGTKTAVETVTAAIPGGAALLPIEDAAYAVLGAVSAVFSASGDAASAKLADAGLDVVAIQKVEELLAQIPQLAALAKALANPAAK